MTSNAGLQGTIALVTGASSGIGEATALELARLGAGVAIAARRRDRLDDLAARIADAGGPGRVLVIEADVGERDQAQAMVAQTVSELGRLGHPGQQRRRHAPRPGPRRAASGVGADDRVNVEGLQTPDIAGAVAYIVTRPWRMSVNEILIRPTEQDS